MTIILTCIELLLENKRKLFKSGQASQLPECLSATILRSLEILPHHSETFPPSSFKQNPILINLYMKGTILDNKSNPLNFSPPEIC